MRAGVIFFFWAPKAATMLSLAALLLRPEVFRIGPLAWAIAVAVTVSSLATLLALRSSLISSAATLAGLAAQAGLVILNFAGLFSSTGLATATSPDGAPTTFASALYFSIVTWTTLGYGDLTPPPPIRLVAAMEALIGYVYFGLIVALTSALYVKSVRPSE